MLIDLVLTQTRDGIRLDGAWRALDDRNDTLAFDAACVVHGTGSNFYSSTFLTALIDHLLELGCPGLCINTRGHDGISTASTNRGGKRLGAAYEIVDDCRHDLHAWIEFLVEEGCRRILLIGHSLGAVKSIYALSQEPNPNIAGLVAISPPLLSYEQFALSTQGSMFLETFARAERLVEAGHSTSLLDVQLPLPMVISAGGYVEKYGPHERYNYLKFLRAVQVPTLVVFGSTEVESNMAFQGGPEAVAALAAVQPRIGVETIPGADHFYTTKRPELLQVVERWIKQFKPGSPVIEVKELDSPDVAELLSHVQLELDTRYPEDNPHPRKLTPEEFREPAGVFLAARQGERFVACGGIRKWDHQSAEVKRMFVEPDARQRGLGRAILEKLEASAHRLGYRLIRLETGDRQPEAVALYERAGYQRIPPYGEFMECARSICFEKRL
jgi:GNAT superfamily N-acetyltransferase/pimeloyl-ACP methyl ester carboxylesterase